MKGISELLHKRKFQKGFTLVELLVVIAIIGVLATLVLLQLGTARARARDTRRITDINQIRTAVEEYFEDNGGHYPTDIYASGVLAPRYIARVPSDPLNNQQYHYAYSPSSDPTAFQIWTNLEQNASALSGAAQIKSATLGWSGDTVDPDPTTCASQTSFDQNQCVYDQGVSQ